MRKLCVIFDLDGTLVDSEMLCNQAFLDLLPACGETVEALMQRYRGRKLALILADLSERLAIALPGDFEAQYRMRVAELFSTQLRPTPGTWEMLAATSFPRCVASSGPPEKIAQALAVTKLAGFFGDNVFSSYCVNSWKPDPGLFLYAANAMGFAPANCVVVEDSEVGLRAAAAAGMTALHYAPAARTVPAVPMLPPATGGCRVFSEMSALPYLLEQLSRGS
jgi:HAD superfamily hydrolase (TIGR01509 family)